MSDLTALRAEARTASAAASTCRLLADDIERRRLLLGVRIEPVRRHHTVEVWDSAAADVSRDLLVRQVARALWHLGIDLAHLVRRLLDEAGELEVRAGQLTEAAVELEVTMVEQEAMGVSGSIADRALDPPLGSPVPTSDVR